MHWGARITAAVALVTAMAIGVSVFLIYGKFVRTFSSIENSRFESVADDIRAAVEAGLDLGVPLPDLTTAQALIDDKMARNKEILGIAVFNANGQAVFRAGQAGETVPPAWLTAVKAPDEDWTADAGTMLVAGTRVSNDSRQTVGGVAVLYSHERHDRMIARAGRSLAEAGLVSALAAIAAAYGGVSLLVRWLRREVGRVQAALDGGNDPAPPELRAALEQTQAALADIAGAEQELGRLSEGGRP